MGLSFFLCSCVCNKFGQIPAGLQGLTDEFEKTCKNFFFNAETLGTLRKYRREIMFRGMGRIAAIG